MKYWLLVIMPLWFVQTGATLAHTGESGTPRQPIPLTQEERAWLDENHTVRVRIADSPPYQIIKPMPSGVVVDYLQAIAKRYGFKIEFVASSHQWTDAMEDLRGPHRHYDLLPAMLRTPEREQEFALTDDYLTAPWVVYTRNDTPYIAGLESLSGKTVAAEKGFVITDRIRRDYPLVRILEVAGSRQALEAVATGQAEAYVGNLAIANFLIKENRFTNLEVAAPTPYGQHTQGMGVRPDWPALASLISKGLADMTPAEINAINQKWGAVEVQPRIDYTLAWRVLAGATLVLLASFYWNRRLSREVAVRQRIAADLRESEARLTEEQDRLRQAQQALQDLNQSLEGQVRQRTAELRETGEAMREARHRAEEASRAKSEFLANMSHEIRTPLNAILGFTQVLGRDPHLNPAQRDSLATIQRSGEHLLTLINDVLDMAKIEAGRMTVQVAPFDLGALLAETEAFFRHRAHARGLTLKLETAELPGRVAGDAMRLRQVLLNLVGNALKFTERGGVTLRVEPVAGGALRFGVTDTGIGIAPEEMARLFQPFSQTDSGRKVRGGTGLGLALSSQFVQLMGGELAATSTAGQGSCFFFTLRLPAVEAATTPAAPPELPVISLAPGQPVRRVLIVDDQPDNRAPLRALLAAINPDPPVLECREAANGTEAVALWEEWQPQVIFMDMRMPVLSGEEATRRIKALMAARPDATQTLIVALTASAFDANRDRFLAAGCDAFSPKPFRAEELFAILERQAGLRFIRAEAAPPSSATLSFEEVAARLAALPDAWRVELREAVALGDFGRITTLIDRCDEHDAALCQLLAQWAYDYDLEAFSRALSGLEGHPLANGEGACEPGPGAGGTGARPGTAQGRD